MTDTTISTGIVAPQDDGTGVTDGEEDFTSAAYFQLLSKYKGDGSYIGEDTNGSATLGFSNVDTGNNEFDLDDGYAYIMGGNHSVQAGAQSVYNVALPNESPYVVVLPNGAANLSLDSGTNDVWLAVEEDSNDSVYIRHGTGLSAPSDPSVKLGTVDASSGATTRVSDLAATSLRSLDTDDVDIAGSDLVASGDFLAAGPSTSHGENVTTTSTSYSTVGPRLSMVWDDWVPSGATVAVTLSGRWFDDTGDVRLYNALDSETIVEQTNISSGSRVTLGPVTYTPSTTNGLVTANLQLRSGSGSQVRLNEPTTTFGIQL